MNLADFKVIPQNNVRKGEVSIEDLKLIVLPEIIKPDLVYDVNLDKFKITSKFVKEQDKGTGFTAITNGTLTYLLRTSESNPNSDLRPKFFKGSTVTTTSDYLKLLTKDLGNDLFLHETKIENYQAFLVSKDVKSPFDVVSPQVTLTEQEIIQLTEVKRVAVENGVMDLEGNLIVNNPVPTEVENTDIPSDKDLMEMHNSTIPSYLNDELDEVNVEEVVAPELF